MAGPGAVLRLFLLDTDSPLVSCRCSPGLCIASVLGEMYASPSFKDAVLVTGFATHCGAHGRGDVSCSIH
jgi:hypothetical protein